jgi:hypothetical protein
MGVLDRLFGKPSVASFAAQMIEALHRAGETAELRFHASEIRILRGGSSDRDWVINLDNMYREYVQQSRTEEAA